MASGIKRSGNRPKGGKNIKSSGKTKRFHNTTEAQASYHKKIAERRSKKLKKNQ